MTPYALILRPAPDGMEMQIVGPDGPVTAWTPNSSDKRAKWADIVALINWAYAEGVKAGKEKL